MNHQAIIRAVYSIVAFLVSGTSFGHGADVIDLPGTGPIAVIYTNAAYSRAISGSPNPAPELKAISRRGIYLNQAYGPAIYSYPGRPNSEISSLEPLPPSPVQTQR
jgi:hypothetical protein